MVEAVAEVKNIAVGDVAERIARNFVGFFDIKLNWYLLIELFFNVKSSAECLDFKPVKKLCEKVANRYKYYNCSPDDS